MATPQLYKFDFLHPCCLFQSVQCFFCLFGCFFCLKVDIVASSGEVPVSVCIHRQSQNNEHWLVIMENVERSSAFVSFSQHVSQPLLSHLGHLLFLLLCLMWNKKLRLLFQLNVLLHNDMIPTLIKWQMVKM